MADHDLRPVPTEGGEGAQGGAPSAARGDEQATDAHPGAGETAPAGVAGVTDRRRRLAGLPFLVAGTADVGEALSMLSVSSPVNLELVSLGPDGLPASDAARALAAEAEALWCHGRFSGAFVRSAVGSLPALEWVHSDFVGVDSLPLAELRARGVVLTNGVGTSARPMAEWVVLGLLAGAKRLHVYLERSRARTWDPSDVLQELEGAEVLLLGLGEVNRLVAEMLVPFGAAVTAWARRPRTTLPAGVQRVVRGEDWRPMLARSDYVVLGVPLTPETSGMLDADALRSMKQGAWLVNVARGALVDEAALLSALDSGHLGGALLDAFGEEPLPADHPLWDRPNVIVVPHHTWSSPKTDVRLRSRFAEELRRWLAGAPLSHPVDFSAGY